MENREIGLIWIAAVLNRLYDGWPRHIRLDMEDIREATRVGPEDEQEAGRLWTDLWEWMEKEGIVRTKARTLSLTRIDFAVLTARGFEALNKPAPRVKEPLGSRMGTLATSVGTEAVKEGTKVATREMVKASGVSETVGAFLGGLLRGYSS